MKKKPLNNRCPLQAECERTCQYVGHELDCRYYEDNAVGEDRTIPDQEERRQEIERRRDEEAFEQALAELEDEEDEEYPTNRNKLVLLPVERLHPHPDNPRKELGDLTELADSIKANGIYQNLTVVPDDPTSTFTTFTVIIGHRRLAASKKAGLTHVPCVVAEMTPKEQIQTMLLENMQRSDLTVYEQAQGFQMMLDMGSTVEEIAEKSGFSATTVRRRVKMMELDQKTLKEVSARQLALGDFDRLAQIDDMKARNKCLEKIGTADFNREVESCIRKQIVKAKLPLTRKLLKEARAKELTQNETWSSKYEYVSAIYLHEWDEAKPLIPKEIKDKPYYRLDADYGRLSFYREHKKAKPVKRSAEEIEKQKRLDAAWEQAHELTEVAYQLRAKFVAGLSLNTKNMTEMLRGAVVSEVLRTVDYVGADRKLTVETLGLDDSRYDPERGVKALAALDDLGSKCYPALIYAGFGDEKGLGYIKGYKGEWPKHERPARLDALYAWLCSLGYEMAEEEKQLQDGSHPLFCEEGSHDCDL